MRERRRLATTTLLAALAALAVTGGCTSGDGSRDSAPASSASGTSSSPSTVAPPPPPRRGACYRLSFEAATRSSSDAAPVRCDRPHTSLTFEVGSVDRLFRGSAPAVDSPAVQRRLSRACPRSLASFLGGSREAQRLSRFTAVWFRPSPEQAAAGADWYRCDVVVLAARDELLGLPTHGRLRGVLDRPESLSTYGLCGTAAPGAREFRRVACARPHSWRAISTIELPGGARYPGVSAVRAAGDEACADQVQELSGFALEIRYGWEWPTRTQWRRGQHYGYCWAPAEG